MGKAMFMVAVILFSAAGCSTTRTIAGFEGVASESEGSPISERAIAETSPVISPMPEGDDSFVPQRLTTEDSQNASPTEGFTNVRIYHLEDDDDLEETTGESMIAFERNYRLYGAVTKDDVQARLGYYYTFFWRTEKNRPVTLRFEYRHGRTGEEIHKLEQVITNVKSKNVSHIQFIGKPYHEFGKVVSWRASLWRDGEEFASTRSFLWK